MPESHCKTSPRLGDIKAMWMKCVLIITCVLSEQEDAGGVLFEHWGKETCPQSTMLVYSDPIGGNRATPSAYGIVYGSEYETNFFGPLSSNQDVPCAVCISKPHTAKVLIPGRNKCYNDWHELYHGYLAGNLYTNAGREGYICMAEHPDFIFGGNANSDGRLFYSVISTCGSLPCPPYNESMPLTCVLCGK
ncbi:hypothetical protein KUTeg_011488 [Tegillarca granosa]|uniref:Short-chain collagen C4-like n=1 Tax=Tegillarca granosa TaxID=220873 RepID=A0ABQ9F442_TEGGR|nr:hypothetical protein KUTeg_011488 [Tegillarca granosa]